MADITQELQKIMEARKGKDVRGSIHDAIDLINKVSEVVFVTGTDVDSTTSSSSGFYEGTLYLNTNTFELWKCVGVDSWESQGIIQGGGGSTVSWNQITASGTKIAEVTINGTKTNVYAPNSGGGGGGGVSSYNELSDLPSLNGETIQGTQTSSDLGLADADHDHAASDITGLASVATSGSYNDLTNKPSIPANLSDLTEDSSHRTVSDTEKATWNAKADNEWHETTYTKTSTGTYALEFANLNSEYAYDLYAKTNDGSMVEINSTSLNGTTGTWNVLVGSSQVPATFKLRILK